MELLERKHLTLLNEAEQRDPASAGNLRACFEVLALAGAIDRDCATRLAPHRLSEGKFILLFLLHGKPDGLSPHQLAAESGVTRATVTGLLDGLERDGLLVRQIRQDDRRKMAVQLTGPGRLLADNLLEQHVAWIASLFCGFSPAERQILSTLLHRIRENVGAGENRASANDTKMTP